jgi:hypothetical protein
MSAQYNAADDYFEADDFDPLHEYEQITGNRLSSYDGPEGLGLGKNRDQQPVTAANRVTH